MRTLTVDSVSVTGYLCQQLTQQQLQQVYCSVL